MDPINTPEMSGSPLQQYTNFSSQKNNLLLIIAATVVIALLGFFFLYSSGSNSTKEVEVPTATPGPVKNREYMMMTAPDTNSAVSPTLIPTVTDESTSVQNTITITPATETPTDSPLPPQ